MKKIVVGFDPGKSGGYCLMDAGKQVLAFGATPLVGEEINIRFLAGLLTGFQNAGGEVVAVLEKVGAMPGQGVCSMFSFGKSTGELRGMIKALGIPLREPAPVSWKKIVLKDTNWKGRKEAAVEHVMKQYPGVRLIPPGCRKPHDGIADAVCLAEWGLMA